MEVEVDIKQLPNHHFIELSINICHQDCHLPWCFRFAISIGIIVLMIILSGITEVKTEECFSNIKNLN